MLDDILNKGICVVVGLFFGSVATTYIASKSAESESSSEITVKQTFFSKSPEDGLEEALEYYGISHPDIVYKQAVLETGHFKSNLCVEGNNLFGLYDSLKGEYCKFGHWHESVRAYKNWVQYKYDGSQDYYEFLDAIGYAQDKNYINILKQIRCE